MHKHGWSGQWPTDEFPPVGSRLRFIQGGMAKDHRIQEGILVSVWMGVEPCLVVRTDDGDKSVFPTLDQFEVQPPPDRPAHKETI